MNTEDFEHKLRSHDPAANLTRRDSAEQRAIYEKALNAQPSNVISISRWSNRRKAVSAAAAALLVIGVGGPVISNSMSASPERLVFGESQTQLNGQSGGGDLRSERSKMSYDYGMMWGSYHFELSSDVVSDLPSSALAYKVVNLPNLQARIEQIAVVLGVENLSTSPEGAVTNSETTDGYANFYAWTETGQASFSYFDSAADPWRNCYTDEPVDDKDAAVCEPITDNLPTKTEAIAAAKKLLVELGFETSDMRFEAYDYDYSIDVNANVQIANADSPINFYLSYVADLEIYSVGGSLTKLVEIGSYDLVTLEQAVARSNELTNRNIEIWNENYANFDGGTVEPRVTDNSSDSSSSIGSSDDGSVSEPSEPTDDSSSEGEVVWEETAGPVTQFEPVSVIVTRAEIQYQMFWMQDGSVLWLPSVMFWGTSQDNQEESQYGTIIAIVDSQIDVESLYSTWGISPLAR